MKSFACACALLVLTPPSLCRSEETIHTAAQVIRIIRADRSERKDFEVRGSVIREHAPNSFTITDYTGYVNLYRSPSAAAATLRAGDLVHVTGHTEKNGLGVCTAFYDTVRVLQHVNTPDPVKVSAKDLLHGKHLGDVVVLRGIVNDICTDDIDPNWGFFTILSEGETVCASFRLEDIRTKDFFRYLGAEVVLTGLCSDFPAGHRHYLGPNLNLYEESDIRILTPPPADPFDCPDLESIDRTFAGELLVLGRRRATGLVLAAWGRNHAILRTAQGRISRADFSDGPLPSVGETIDVSGFPHTDLYHLDLSRATWRKAEKPMTGREDPPENVSAEELLTDGQGAKCVSIQHHGRCVRLCGTVLTLPVTEGHDGIFNLKCGNFIIPVDISACGQGMTDIAIGCNIRATGICVIRSTRQHPTALIPTLDGFTLVMRSPQDVEVIARPPWWTPVRLLTVIGTLLAVLVAILIWNLLLRRAVERRSRALEKEITARIGSDLKVYERTRLAVELHDSLAQNLSGVSLEIDAASDFAKENPDEMMRHLGIASSALKSCRDELRNCLWDLRNQSLEDEDMDTAIRRTLTPHLAGAKLSVRFNVPRTRLPDNVAHAILRIIRELTINAVRHGHAKDIKVAGCIENGHLLFSVRDNGCGFDPDNHPGVEQGHYGLQGICERAEDLDGDMSIESRPGHGAKVTVRIDATPNTKAGNEQ